MCPWQLGDRSVTREYIAVVWEHIQDDPWTVYPVTAYETNPPGG